MKDFATKIIDEMDLKMLIYNRISIEKKSRGGIDYRNIYVGRIASISYNNISIDWSVCKKKKYKH